MPAGGGLAVGGCRDARSGRFRTGSSACQPVIEALAVIRRHAAAGSLTYYPAGEHVPAHAGITEDWKPLVYRTDQHGRQRVVRMVYEVVTFQALREHLRCKEIWITGADRWRNPDEDLPADFETRRAEHYASLRKPLDPAAFIAALQEEMRAEFDALGEADEDRVGRQQAAPRCQVRPEALAGHRKHDGFGSLQGFRDSMRQSFFPHIHGRALRSKTGECPRTSA